MKIIRRLYLYAVALISLEVVVWGLIGLARSAFAGDEIGGDVARLAGALALIFVGIPVFLLHWWLAQKNAREDADERNSYIRAVFLYGALLFTLIPVSQNILTLVNRVFFSIFDLSRNRVMFGYGQTWSDNLIAIVMNGLIAAYIFSILRKDWAETPVGNPITETRRLYRYIWVIYGLVLLIFGISQTLLYIFDFLGDASNAPQTILADGLTLIIVGAPIWVLSWRIVQKSLSAPQEQESLLREIILSIVKFISQVITLFAAGAILEVVLRTLLGEGFIFTKFIDEIGDPISILIPMGIVWGYYGFILRRSTQNEQTSGASQLSSYALSLLGLIVSFAGMQKLLDFIIDFSINNKTWDEIYLDDFTIALAMLIIGLPVWIFNWRKVNKNAAIEGQQGDQARQSIVQKIYLYLVLFMGVMGVMISAGVLIFQLLQALLGEPDDDLVQISLNLTVVLVMFFFVIWYHGLVLRSDGRLFAKSQAERFADFPVLVLVSELGDFSEMLIATFQKETPTMPVAVHLVDQGAPDETLSDAKVVILPASIATSPGEAIRLWLQEFSGTRFMVPTPVQGWVWVCGYDSHLQNLVRQTVEMVKKLAKGEDIFKTRTSSPWTIFGYILGGILGLMVTLMVISILIDVLL